MFQASGSGPTEEIARQEALSTLSSILYTQVTSIIETRDFVTMIDSEVGAAVADFAKHIQVSTELPILGASFRSTVDSHGQHHVMAFLDGETSLALYEQEVERLTSLINAVDLPLIAQGNSLQQEQELAALLSYYGEYEKLLFVTGALGGEYIPALQTSRYEIERALAKAEGIIDSYQKAARVLAAQIKGERIYVYPPKLDNSGAVTEFAELLAWAMQDALGSQSVYNPELAHLYMVGSYTLEDEGEQGIHVSYRLEDRSGAVLNTAMALLLPAAYAGQRYIPLAYDFQKQLERGEAVDTAFRADIRINGMQDYLSFHRGDELIIEVQANQPCYFYIVGYVFTEEGEELAYLFPLQLDAVGKDIFARRISADQVGKWVSVNPSYGRHTLPIEIIEPYGVEMLQVYASTDRSYQRFLDTIPGFRETAEYYIISEDPNAGLSLTRALNIKSVADFAAQEIAISEASVTFKTAPVAR
ncbi:MAG TPA: hypothetical protein VFC80_02335 [Sphaerochaeta sp.]|nr:hypothetical protein [Sphaerochaeta sp.]